jgi:hypothetical protein
MDSTTPDLTLTHHAMLVVWGQYAHYMGLIAALEALPMHQKTYHHRPQTKILEFLVAVLAGLPHLQDLSVSAHPIVRDQAVARAWGQPAWADYSGVSRTLQVLTMTEAQQIVQVLEKLSQPKRRQTGLPDAPSESPHRPGSVLAGTPGRVRRQFRAVDGALDRDPVSPPSRRLAVARPPRNEGTDPGRCPYIGVGALAARRLLAPVHGSELFCRTVFGNQGLGVSAALAPLQKLGLMRQIGDIYPTSVGRHPLVARRGQ